MTKIKVSFPDCTNPFFPKFHQDNIFLFLLKKIYDIVEIDDINPDIIFYSVSDTNNHLNYKNCKKIFFVGEPGFWSKDNFFNFYSQNDRCYKYVNDSDYVLSSYFLSNEKNIRFPIYIVYAYNMIVNGLIPDLNFFLKPKEYTLEDIKNKKFCVALIRNRVPQKRIEFMNKLSLYKKVDDLSIPGYTYEKCKMIKYYKFTMGFENVGVLSYNPTVSLDNGLVSEKILEPFAVKSIPLYWGEPLIYKEFNVNSFINWHDYLNDDNMIKKIIELDQDDNKYLEMLNQNITFKNSFLDVDYLVEIMKKIVK